MILSLGTDIVNINRLKKWDHFSYDQLSRIFSKEELAFCRHEDSYNWQSLAARFAAKEAFFKALSSLLVKLKKTNYEFSFLFLCSHIRVHHTIWDVPELIVDWKAIEEKTRETLPLLQVDVSLSHEQEYAVAFVVLLTD